MKNLSLFLVVALAAFGVGCNSDIEPEIEQIPVAEQFEIDIEKIDNWLTENGITDTLVHPHTRIRYTVSKTGTGIKPQPGDIITAAYEGRLLGSGEIFDSSPEFGPFVLNTGSIILGWYYLLQEMREGSEITIYVPSFYAYGSNGTGSIPANAVLVFDITLIRVEN
jgi:FKBP-type peptidyl-prolyl cis-trans isomerase FkpA